MKAQESFCISPEVITGFRALLSNFCFTNFNVFTHRIQWEESFEAFLFIVAQIKSRTNICWLLVTQTYWTFKDKQGTEPSIDATRVVSGGITHLASMEVVVVVVSGTALSLGSLR